LSWEPIALHELLHFGKWIFLSSVLTFFATSADKLILGALTGATFLGLYTIAFNLVDLPAQLVGRLMLNAAFPALSQVARERTQDLKRVYYKFHSVAAPAAYLLAGMLFVASPMIISTLYDARYREAGWIMQCLSFSLLALPFQLAGHHFTAIGKPELISVVLVARVLGLLTATPLAFHFFQLPGVVAAIVLAHLCVVPVLAFFSWRLGLLDIRKEATATIGFPVGVAIGLGIDTALRTLHEALGS
jgi:O-antigen/teichoic acid export membrane protein